MASALMMEGVSFDGDKATPRPSAQMIRVPTNAGQILMYLDDTQNPYLVHTTEVEPESFVVFLCRVQNWITIDDTPHRQLMRQDRLHEMKHQVKEILELWGGIEGVTITIKIPTQKIRELISTAQTPMPPTRTEPITSEV